MIRRIIAACVSGRGCKESEAKANTAWTPHDLSLLGRCGRNKNFLHKQQVKEASAYEEF